MINNLAVAGIRLGNALRRLFVFVGSNGTGQFNFSVGNVGADFVARQRSFILQRLLNLTLQR